jgi:hypothetical protein
MQAPWNVSLPITIQQVTKTKVLPTCLFLLVNLFFVFGFELDAFRLMICLFPLLYILICSENYLHLVVGY